MVCEICGSKISQNNKCFNCGHDNSSVKTTTKYVKSSAIYRSVRLTVFLYLLIIINAILISLTVSSIFNYELNKALLIISTISIVLAAFEILLSVFMLKLKKWALKAYIITNIIAGVIRIFALDFITVIIKALFLYFIFRNDWEYFE